MASDDVEKFGAYMDHYLAVLAERQAKDPNGDVTELVRFQVAMARVVAACNVRDDDDRGDSAVEEAMVELRNIVLHRPEIRDMAERHMAKEKKE